MKKIFLLLNLAVSIQLVGQDVKWIPFLWEKVAIEDRWFDKSSMAVPVKIENLPHQFYMQLDFGATTTVLYGNAFQPYHGEIPYMINKIDSTMSFFMEEQRVYLLKGVDLQLGEVPFKNTNVGLYENYDEGVATVGPVESSSEIVNVGTIGPDLFKDKILIIDYKERKIGVTEILPTEYENAVFLPFTQKYGRISIPITIDNQVEKLLFDTGSSIFSLLTIKENADKISDDKIIDSIKAPGWGENYYMVYGKNINKEIKFGEIKLHSSHVYYDDGEVLKQFFQEEGIWGITGNAFFFDNVVIIDYKNEKFGVK